jgi:hypothetical protein
MIFSLFNNPKETHKIKLKNSNKVCLGSNTDLEWAFQIGNFMNMLYKNIENESQTMTNSVIRFNLLNYVSELVDYCISQTEDNFIKSSYLFGKEQVYTWINRVIDEIEQRKKLENKQKNLKNDIKNEIKEIIDLSIKSTYLQYNQLCNEIVWLFSKYYQKI